MRKTVYLSEPGFVYDLIQRFHVNFDFEASTENTPDNLSTEIQSFFAAPPDDLRVFFDRNNAEAPMLMTRYFERFGALLSTGKYTYAYLREQLSDLDGLLHAMTAHFFPLLTPKEVDKQLTELRLVTRQVMESDYDDALKNRLLCFFIEPEHYQKLLLSELDIQAARLRAYYEKNKPLIQHIRDSLSLETLSEQFQSIPEMSGYLRGDDPVVFSCPIIDRQVIYFNQAEDSRILMLGLDYQASLESIARKVTRPDLYLFGKILSEPKRLRLIDTLLDGRAMRKDDICTLLNLSMTATHYHIDMMSRAWMLSCESRGRTFYYTLNRAYFDDIIQALRKYSTEGDKKENN